MGHSAQQLLTWKLNNIANKSKTKAVLFYGYTAYFVYKNIFFMIWKYGLKIIWLVTN